MAELLDRSDSGAGSPSPAGRLVKGRWQVGLRTFFVLILAVAAWLGMIVNREKTLAMRSQLEVLRSLGRVLEVHDPDKIAAAKKHDQWHDEDRWELYLPSRSYRICMASRMIGVTGFPPTMKSIPIRPGRHRIALDQRKGDGLLKEGGPWKAVLACDGTELLTLEEPKDFPFHNFGGYLEDLSISQQFAADQPVILCHHQYSLSPRWGFPSFPAAPMDGIMVWIETEPGGTPAR